MILERASSYKKVKNIIDCNGSFITKGGRGMSNDIFTMYTKDKNMKSGRKGYFRWQDEKEKAIRPLE